MPYFAKYTIIFVLNDFRDQKTTLLHESKKNEKTFRKKINEIIR